MIIVISNVKWIDQRSVFNEIGVSLTRRPDAGIAAQQAAAQDLAPAMDRKRPSTFDM